MFFLFNRTTLQFFVTCLRDVLYMNHSWFYKHQHDNRFRSKLFVACQRWWFQWRFWFIPSVPGYTHTLSLETVHTTFEWNCIIQTSKCKTYIRLFEMIVGVLTTCHKTIHLRQEYMFFFLFNRTTFQVFVTYLTGALYVHPLWFYKHQHDNRVRSKLFVACQRWWFQWRFWFVPSVPGYLREEEEHKPDPWRNPIERNHMGLHLENEVAVVKTPTVISNNPVFTVWKSLIRKMKYRYKFLMNIYVNIDVKPNIVRF